MKKIVIFAMAMAISVTVPISVMAGNIVQTDAEMKPSGQNIEQIIDEIAAEPHPINFDAIQNVKEYIIKYFSDLGYDNIECQKFEYNDENNENAIRRSSQTDVFLAPTAENATIDGTGENIIVTKKSSTDTTKNLLGVAANTKLSKAEMKKLEEVADELNVKILGPDLFRFAVRK